MSFGFNTTVIKNDSIDLVGLLNAEESLHQAYCDLLDSQRQLVEVNEVMENIHTSIDLIAKYGQDGVKQLNVDGSLEHLLNIPAKMITAEKAQEGFGDVAADLWKKFKDLVAAIWDAIKRSVKFIIDKLVQFGGWVSSKIKVANTATPEQWKAAGELKVNAPVSTESIKDWYSPTTLYPAKDILALLKDYEEYLKIVYRAYHESNPSGAVVEVLAKYQSASPNLNLKTHVSDMLGSFSKKIQSYSSTMLKATVNWNANEPNVIPANIVTFSSPALLNYKPQETTYLALGWAGETEGKANTLDFLDRFGKCQTQLGELQKGCELTQRVFDEGIDKISKIFAVTTANANNAYKDMTQIQNVCRAIGHSALTLGFEQHKVLLTTFRTLGPMFEKLTEK